MGKPLPGPAGDHFKKKRDKGRAKKVAGAKTRAAQRKK